MKTKTFTLFFLSCFLSFAQQDNKNKTNIHPIEIDVKSTIYKKKSIKTAGNYEIFISNYDSDKSYEIEIGKTFHEYEPLTIPKADSTKLENFKFLDSKKVIDTISIKHGEDLSIKIDVFKTNKDSTGNDVIEKEKTYNYTFTTERKGKWQTTFGFNFIALGNTDAFFSKQIDSVSYAITKGTNQNKLDFHPTLMFTWVPNNTNNIKLGYSGGLGYDLDNSLSVFGGLSLIFNQNITLSAGFAFHNQKLLNSQYREGDIIKENLDFDQLHKDYIRFNPFISLAFRLDKSPF